MSRRIKKATESLSPIRRLAIALGHPLRVRILSALVAGEGSATTLSRQFGDATVGDVSYHLGVLADDCDLIERVRSKQVRGALENFYRLKPPGSALGGVELPKPIVQGLRVELFCTFVDAAVAALDAGSFDTDDETTFAAKPVTVDPQGLAEINQALREAMERVKRAEAESRRRLELESSTEAVSAVVGAAAFQPPSPPEPGGGAMR
jgi:DNA-binding transcriptional ArsR family regulator